MKYAYLMAGLLISAALNSPAQGAAVKSFFPDKNLGRFLAEHFDLATIRSSFGPRRTPATRTFSDFGMKPSQVTENLVEFRDPDNWLYELHVLGRGDFNRDGIEDLKVCFIDQALNGGSYDTAQGLLLTRYSTKGYAIALSFSPEDGLCPNYAK